MSSSVRPRTVAIASHALNFLSEAFPGLVQDITPQGLERFKNHLLNSKNSNGANIIIRNVKTFLQFCVQNGYLDKSPGKEVKQFKVQPVARFLTRPELALLYRNSHKRLRRAIYVFYNTGLRRGEFLGIRQEDIGRDFVTVTGKMGVRKVPLKPLARTILLKTVGSWTAGGLDNAFKVAARHSRIGRIRLHDLRHTFASAYLKCGGTLADLRLLGGWKSLTTLQIYAHFQEDYLAQRMVRVKL